MTIEVKETNITSVVKAAIIEHGATHESIVPILSEINKAFGYIPNGAFTALQQQLQSPENGVMVSESQLFSVASFYHMLSTKPRGRHVVRFCESAPCHVMGGRELLTAIVKELGLRPGETSLDNKWSFVTTSCLGVCGVGPVVMVDEDIFGNVRPEQLPEILARYD